MRITLDDIEMLKKYESLLYKQNERILLQIKNSGYQTLKPQDRKELNELLLIKKKKKYIIDRMTAQKEEQKLRLIEEEIKSEANKGIRRSQLMPRLASMPVIPKTNFMKKRN